MTWHEITKLEAITNVVDIIGSPDLTFIRSFNTLDAINQKLQLVWRLDIASDEISLPYRRLVLANGFIVFANVKNRTVFLFGVESTTGEIRWKRQLAWNPIGHTIGLQQVGGLVGFIEVAGDRRRLIFVDPQTGVEVIQTNGLAVPTTGVSVFGAKTAASNNNSLFAVQHENGLYRYVLDQTSSFEKFASFNARQLAIVGNQVHCYAWVDGDSVLLRLDATTGAELSRANLRLTEDEDVENIHTWQNSTTPHLIAVSVERRRGVVLVDTARGHWLWHLGRDEGWYVPCIEWTPYGLAAIVQARVKTKLKKRLIILNAISGNIIKHIELAQIRGHCYWTGAYLYVGTSFGLVVLQFY